MEIQPGSGCGHINKEDLVDETWMTQAKATKKKAIPLRYEDLFKLMVHATEKSKLSALFIGFAEGGGFIDQRIWVLTPLPIWSAMKEGSFKVRP